MKFRHCLLVISIQVFLSPLFAQNKPDLDPAGIRDNFLDINYFNNIWLKSTDINKNDAEGFTRRAADKIDKGYFEEAFSDIEKAISIEPDYAYPYFLKGIYFLNRMEIDSAENAFIRSYKIDTLNTMPVFYLGLSALYSKDYDNASAYFNEITISGNNQFLGYYGLASLALAKGELEEGRNQLKKAAKANPEFIEASFTLGLVEIMDYQLIPAERIMDYVISIKPQYAPAYFVKGIINWKSFSRKKVALDNLNKAVELDPENYGYLAARAELYHSLKKTEEAFNDIFRVLELECVKRKWQYRGNTPENISHHQDSWFLFSLLKENRNQFNYDNKILLMDFMLYYFDNNGWLCREIFSRLQKSEDNPLLEILDGMMYEKLEDPSPALECYKKAISRSPDSYYAYMRSGIVNYRLKKYDEAINDLNKAVSINDTINEIYRWRGISCYEAKRTIDAARDFNFLLRKDSTNTEIRFYRARLLTGAESWESALMDLDKILFYDERNADAIHLKAKCLYNLTDFDGLVEYLNKLKPELITVEELKMLGYSYMQRRDYAKAIESLSKYILANGFDIQAVTWRGSCNFSINDYPAARNDFDQCIRYNKDEGLFYYLRGMASLKMKNISDACSDFLNADLKGYKVPIDYKSTCEKK